MPTSAGTAEDSADLFSVYGNVKKINFAGRAKGVRVYYKFMARGNDLLRKELVVGSGLWSISLGRLAGQINWVSKIRRCFL